MFKTLSLCALVALSVAKKSEADKAWAEESWKVNGDSITITVDKHADTSATPPKAQWHKATNSAPFGAKSYAMLSTDSKNTFLVFSEKEMTGSDMPKGDDKVAVYAYDKPASASLERDGDKQSFQLTLVKAGEKVEDAKSLEREEEFFFPFFPAAAFLAGPAIAAATAFTFAGFPFAMSQTSLSASLEKLGSDLEVMDVPINGLEREEKFFFAPFFIGPAMAAFGAGAFFAPALAAGALAMAR